MLRRVLTAIIFLGPVALPSLRAAEPIEFELEGEKIEIPTDSRAWGEGSRNSAGNKGVVEYVLPGEDVKNWTELVSINYFQGLEETGLLERFLKFTKDGLQTQCGDVQWQDLEKKSNGMIYTWSAQDCQGGWPDQAEVARVIKGQQGLYVLHYASKTVPIPQEKRETWASLFNKANTKNPS